MDFSRDENVTDRDGFLVDWQRHNGVEQLAILNTDRRPYLYPTPVLREDLSELLNYETDTKLGVSLTLNYRLWRALYYPEVLVKQACWLVKHLCERTDMIKQRVPIRFGITTDLREMVIPYLEACQFPMGLVDWIESREVVYPQSTKFIHLQHDSFKEMERVMHMDLTLHFDTDETQHKGWWFKDIKRHWMTQPMALLYPLISSEELGNRLVWVDRTMKEWNWYWGENVSAEEHLMWKTISESVGESAESLKEFFLDDDYVLDVPTHLFGFSRQLLDSLILEDDIYPVMRVSNCEVAMEVYAYQQKWKNDDVASIEPAFNWLDTIDRIKPHCEYGIRYSDAETNIEDWNKQYG